MRNKEKDTINIVIGKHMAELRAKFNLSQKEICQVIGVNRNTYKDYEIGNRTIPLQILRDLSKFYKVSSDYFFEDMPELTEKEQRQLFRYSTAVANDKEKYIALDLTNPNAMKEYFKLLIAIILSTVNPLTTPPSYMACVSEYVTPIPSKLALFHI